MKTTVIHLGDAGRGGYACGVSHPVPTPPHGQGWVWKPEQVTCKRCLKVYRNKLIRTKAIGLGIILLLCLPLHAQDSPSPKWQHRQFWVSAATVGVLTAADVASTIKLRQLGAVEMNPLLGKRPGPAKIAIGIPLGNAAWFYAIHRLETRGHYRIGQAMETLSIGDEAWCVNNNARLVQRLERVKR